MEQPQSRYHGKVRVQTGDTIVEINIFDDSREKLYLEVQQALDQFSNDRIPGEAAQSEPPRASQARAAAAPSPAPKPAPKQQASAPICRDCGEECKLVRWTDKTSGKAMSRYKCDHCGTWAPR